MGWTDIGSWDAVYDFSDRDAEGNALSGNILALGAEGSLIHSDGPTVAAIGVKDLLILVSGESVLVLPRGESQKVTEIADLVAKRRSEEHTSELQSLMRNSYAVFCLRKKTVSNPNHYS